MEDPNPDPYNILFKVLFIFLLVLCGYFLRFFESAVESFDESGLSEKENLSNAENKILRVKKSERRFCLSLRFFYLADITALAFFVLRFCYNPLASVIHSGAGAAAVIGAVFCVVVFILFEETAVKSGIIKNERAIYSAGVFSFYAGGLLKPFMIVSKWISGAILKTVGVNPKDAFETPTESDIRQLVDEAEEIGELEESQKEMINNVFEFDDISVGDIMTHRTDIVAIENTDDISELISQAINEGFSRIPVYEGDLDNIIGIIHVKDLLKYVGKTIPESVTVKKFLRGVYYVPETKRCDDLFHEMTDKKSQMAVVVDEYGGTAGIVTLEDLIEAVLGNIQDEYDNEKADIEKVSDGIFEMDGATDIEEAGETIGIRFPEGDYDTLGGMIISMLGHIPDENESIRIDNILLTVIASNDRKIEKVKAETAQITENPVDD